MLRPCADLVNELAHGWRDLKRGRLDKENNFAAMIEFKSVPTYAYFEHLISEISGVRSLFCSVVRRQVNLIQ